MNQRLEQLDLFPHSLEGTNVVFDKHSFTREFIEDVEIINKDDPVNHPPRVGGCPMNDELLYKKLLDVVKKQVEDSYINGLKEGVRAFA